MAFTIHIQTKTHTVTYLLFLDLNCIILLTDNNPMLNPKPDLNPNLNPNSNLKPSINFNSTLMLTLILVLKI